MTAHQFGGRVKRVLSLAFALLVVAAVVAWYVLPIEEWVLDFTAWIESLGASGVIAFGIVYVVGTLLMAPASVMSITAGLAFGLWGVPFVLAAGTTGAALAFLLARYVAHERVTQALEGHPNFKAVGRAIDEEGWKVVGLMRLSPPVPFAVTNYFFGVTNVGFWPFVLTTLIGIVPATLVYVNLGAMGQAAVTGREGHAMRWVLLALGLVATVAAAVLVTRKAKEKLRGAEGT